MDILIKNAVVLKPDYELEEGLCVGIRGDEIAYVGKEECPAERVIDARGDVLMPSFVNAHKHLPMSLLRGAGEDLPLMDWLTKKIFPIEAKLTDESVYWGTMACLLDMIKGGQTAAVDMYFRVEQIARAVAKSGVRALVGHCVTGASAAEAAPQIEKARSFIKNWEGHALVEPYYSLHAEYTCTEDVIAAVAQDAKNAGKKLCIHASETKSEHEECKARHGGKTPIALLESLGALDVPSIIAHCVWAEDRDMDILAAHGATVATCPTSNLKLASGIARVSEMLRRGVNVAVGTDGAASADLDMLSEMRLCALLQKGTLFDATAMPKKTALKLATENGAKVFNADFGTIAPGKKADMILLDTANERYRPRRHMESHIFYSSLRSDVRMTMCAGRVLYMDGEILYADEKEILAKFDECTQKLYEA